MCGPHPIQVAHWTFLEPKRHAVDGRSKLLYHFLLVRSDWISKRLRHQDLNNFMLRLPKYNKRPPIDEIGPIAALDVDLSSLLTSIVSSYTH